MSKQVILDYEDHQELLDIASEIESREHTITVRTSRIIDDFYYRTWEDERIIVKPVPLTGDLSTVFDKLEDVIQRNESVRVKLHQDLQLLKGKQRDISGREERADATEARLLKYYRKLTEMSFKERLVYLFTGKLPGRINENI